MTARIFKVGGLTAGALALLLAAPARAGIGDGIRLGGSEGVVHPFVEVESRFDSNVYTNGSDSQGDLVFHFRPGLKLDVPGEMLTVDARAALEWVQYMGLTTQDTADISGLWADAGLRLSVNPKGRVSFELRDAFRRSNQVQALSLATPAIANYNLLSATVPFMPGGGALVFAVGGDWAVEAYEPISEELCPPADPSCGLDKLGYSDVQGRGSVIWKFLPRTQATFDVGYSQRLPSDETLSPKLGTLRVLAGLSGLVTTQFGATIRAGYGMTTADDARYEVGTWLATVEAEWLPVTEASVKFGYTHGLGTEPGNEYAVYSMHRASADARYKVARRYSASLSARYDVIAYEVAGNATTANVLLLEPSVKAEVSRWLRADFGYTFTRRATPDYFGTGPKPETFDYDRHAVFLRASVIY